MGNFRIDTFHSRSEFSQGLEETQHLIKNEFDLFETSPWLFTPPQESSLVLPQNSFVTLHAFAIQYYWDYWLRLHSSPRTHLSSSQRVGVDIAIESSDASRWSGEVKVSQRDVGIKIEYVNGYLQYLYQEDEKEGFLAKYSRATLTPDKLSEILKDPDLTLAPDRLMSEEEAQTWINILGRVYHSGGVAEMPDKQVIIVQAAEDFANSQNPMGLYYLSGTSFDPEATTFRKVQVILPITSEEGTAYITLAMEGDPRTIFGGAHDKQRGMTLGLVNEAIRLKPQA